MKRSSNMEVFSNIAVVNAYETDESLTPAEHYLFQKYIRDRDAILDLGVGGGRTTSHLWARSGKYIGIDYAMPMVVSCRKRFPELEFHCCDASDLSRFKTHSFDTVVFSFNGIDYFGNDQKRQRCILEIRRVLKNGGRLIFSSHHSRYLPYWPETKGANAARFLWRIGRFFYKTIPWLANPKKLGLLLQGAGYRIDPIHGGLETYYSCPKVIRQQTEPSGFRMLEAVGNRFPQSTLPFSHCWIYYVLEAA